MEILCPVCKNVLYKELKSYRCFNGHSFDIAKEGYINLNLKSSAKTGDEKEMVKARRDFLEKDHYKFLKDKLIEIIDIYAPENLLDLACGEGYYTKDFKATNKLAVDLSKEALKMASKKDKTSIYILKSIFDLPIKDNSVDLATTIFAPVSCELSRILKNGGHFILVKPDVDHLYELKQVVYKSPYLNEIENIEIAGLKLENEIKIKQVTKINNFDLINLFKMTPYYHKTSINDFHKLDLIQELNVTFSFIVDIYQKQNRTY